MKNRSVCARRRRYTRPPKNCGWAKCGIAFTPRQDNQKYHSRYCNLMAWKERHPTWKRDRRKKELAAVRELKARERAEFESACRAAAAAFEEGPR